MAGRAQEKFEISRYSRQILVDHIGPRGQERIRHSSVLLVGCGALGSVAADLLVRAGVGMLRVCDRDFIEPNNLQRQVLFDEDDIAADLPKAEAAARKLRRINSGVRIEPVVADVTHSNIQRLAEGAHLIIDGTDNFEARYLMNDFAVSTGRPWVYGAVIATTGLCLAIVPGATPCLRCLFEDPPPAELSPTCDTAGVLAPAAHAVASFQVIEALKILVERPDEVRRGLLQLDVWSGRVISIRTDEQAADCPCCVRREFPYLSGRAGSAATLLCGRNAVQIRPQAEGRPDLDAIAKRLGPVSAGGVRQNGFLLRARLDGCDVTLFADGRVIIQGLAEADRARSLYARYFGA